MKPLKKITRLFQTTTSKKEFKRSPEYLEEKKKIQEFNLQKCSQSKEEDLSDQELKDIYHEFKDSYIDNRVQVEFEKNRVERSQNAQELSVACRSFLEKNLPKAIHYIIPSQKELERRFFC